MVQIAMEAIVIKVGVEAIFATSSVMEIDEMKA
jgi:hypothetical protein